MDPSNQPEASGQPKRPLPPELKFLTNLPDVSQMEAEDIAAYIHQQHALIRQHADLIRAHNMDPDTLIAFTASGLVQLEKSIQACDESDQFMFHAIADRADAERAAFKELKAIVEARYAEYPFDESVQEAKEFIDEWSKRMPKE